MTASNRKIAILGANGRVGRVAAKAFAQAGWHVIAVTRSGAPTGSSAAEFRKADALDQQALIEACRGCGFIFNALNPIYTRWREQVMPLAHNVIAAAKANQAVHLFPGNVYNFGSHIGEVSDEKASRIGDHPKARLRIEAEAAFRKAAQEDGVKTLILRPGDFFGGTGTGSWFDLVITSRLARGTIVYPGSMDVVHSWAYLPDVADAFVRLARKSGELSNFEEFNFEGHAVTGEELVGAIRRVVGRELKVAGFPWRVFRLGAFFVPMWREVHEVSYLWKRPHRLDASKLEKTVGPLQHTPLDTAIACAIRDLDIMPLGHNAARALPSLAA